MLGAAAKRVEIGVVLQGGGALGAYECGGMCALLELVDESEAAGCCPTLRTVSGVSIGAINAACVVGASDRKDATGIGGAPGDQHHSDGQFGLRDFSRKTVRRRRDDGYRIARTCLSPVFASFGLASQHQSQPTPTH